MRPSAKPGDPCEGYLGELQLALQALTPDEEMKGLGRASSPLRGGRHHGIGCIDEWDSLSQAAGGSCSKLQAGFRLAACGPSMTSGPRHDGGNSQVYTINTLTDLTSKISTGSWDISDRDFSPASDLDLTRP